MSDRNSSSSGSRLRRWLKAPVRMLSRACDCYVRCMTSCAGGVQHGGALGYPTAAPLPRTSSSGDDDLRDLIRANSVSRMGEELKWALPQPTVPPRRDRGAPALRVRGRREAWFGLPASEEPELCKEEGGGVSLIGLHFDLCCS
ncbi:hypothetical protein MUK42_10389 [Musa troglodytarum]|uniref:Uncharacterized protein n=1 Tax=Musa troglodytarum TaxID=320322 RepID=A0A9E7GRR2_9LILI|nr:hypothetical protein MUK42_10389 [Musa troglodytarum]